MKSRTFLLNQSRATIRVTLLSFFLLATCIWVESGTHAASAQYGPSISGFWPSTNTNNGRVLVFGSGFIPNGTSVSVGGQPALLVQVMAPDMLVFVLPSGVTSGAITLVTDIGSVTSTRNFGDGNGGSELAIHGVWGPGCLGTANTDAVFVFGSGFVNNKTTVAVGGTPFPLVQVVDPTLMIFFPTNTASGYVTVATTDPVQSQESDLPFVLSRPPATAPLPLSLAHTTFDYASGVAALLGWPGAVEPCVNVEVWDQANTLKNVASADSLGRFGVFQINAAAGDVLSVRVRHPDGRVGKIIDAGVEKDAITTVPVVEDPFGYGDYPVGTLELDDEGAFCFDDGGGSSTESDSSLAWARIMYPAVDGTPKIAGAPTLNAPVSTREMPPEGFPVVLVLHANHLSCDYQAYCCKFGADNSCTALCSDVVRNKPETWISSNYPQFKYSKCYNDPKIQTGDENRSLRIPNHEGYNYLLERLASHGIIAVSINKIRAYYGSVLNRTKCQSDNNPVDISATESNAQVQLVLNFLKMFEEWNSAGIKNQSDTDGSGAVRFPFPGLCDTGQSGCNALKRNMFVRQLNLQKIGLLGHSMGGASVIDVWDIIRSSQYKAYFPYLVTAIGNIAPEKARSSLSDVPYLVLTGARDADIIPVAAFTNYVFAGNPKTAQYVYGANHVFFNTVSTNEPDLTCESSGARPKPNCACVNVGDRNCIPKADALWALQANPWVGSEDEALLKNISVNEGGGKILAFDQRSSAIFGVIPFFRRHLHGKDGYDAFIGGDLRFLRQTKSNVFYTSQDGQRKIVDDFAYPIPLDKKQNALLSSDVSGSGFTMFTECAFTMFGFYQCSEPMSPVLGGIEGLSSGYGVVLGWQDIGTYVTTLPDAHVNVSGYDYLSVHLAETVSRGSVLPTLSRINLYVSLEDGSTPIHKSVELRTDHYAPIPYPYTRFGLEQAVVSEVRIPLRHFTLNNSRIDLTNVRKIVFRTEGAGYVGISKIEFERDNISP